MLPAPGFELQDGCGHPQNANRPPPYASGRMGNVNCLLCMAKMFALAEPFCPPIKRIAVRT
jgi:hypothetical protein